MVGNRVIATFDGPKSVGKSTLIGLLGPSLETRGLKVWTIVEKEVVPTAISRRLEDLYAEFRRSPGQQADQAIAQALLEARLWISQNLLAEVDADIVLLDRWYPSDTVFRRFLDPIKVVEANLSAGVLVPDIVFAVTCEPETSWGRAIARSRGLDSKVVSSFDEHQEVTRQFVAAAEKYGWDIVRTDDHGAEELAKLISSRLNQISLARNK